MGALPPSAGWIDNFVPTVASFKSSPADHAACFNCHWKIATTSKYKLRRVSISWQKNL